MATETKNQFGEFLKGLFWIFLLFLVFGVLASFPAHSAETLPIGNFLTAPVSKVEIEQDKSVTFTYAPEKLNASKTSSEFLKLADLITISKTPIYGNVDFLVKQCANVTKSQTTCLEFDTKNETCKTPKTKTWVIQECKPFDFSSKVILEKGAIFQVVPDLSTAIYEKQPDGSSRYRVWEDLFIQGEKIEGATYWDGIEMTLYENIGQNPTGDRNTDLVQLSQTITAAANESICVIEYNATGTAAAPGATTIKIEIRNSTGLIATTNSTIPFTQDQIPHNASFSTCANLRQNYVYNLNFTAAAAGKLGLRGGGTAYTGGCAGREDSGFSCATWNTDFSIRLWGFVLDTTPPIIDACSPPNGSAFSLGVIQFRLNASDNAGLAALNHSDTFTGTTAYNHTPLNATPWYLNIDFNTSGVYYWNAWVNDTSGNTNTTGNCSIEILAATTTTTAPANTTTTVNLVVPGLGWFFAFFIVLVGFVVLGGLSK
jgi:hypothetical protein